MSFANAPVTKGLMLGLGSTSLLVSLFDIKPYFHLQLIPHISRHHQYWRLISHHLACTNSSSLLLAELLLYNASVSIERLFGSVKYASFITVSALVSSILSFFSLIVFYRLGINMLPAGPVAIIFSILYQYHRLVPSAYNFQISALKLTNKFFLYVLAWQFLASQLPGSGVAALTGILTGLLYRADVLGLKSYRLPKSLQKFGHLYLIPLIGSLRPPRRSNQAVPDDMTQRAETLEAISTAASGQGGPTAAELQQTNPQGDRESPAGAGRSVVNQWMNELTGRTAASGIRVPTDAEIEQVSNMFPDVPRQSVVLALQRSPDIEHAVETLLAGAT